MSQTLGSLTARIRRKLRDLEYDEDDIRDALNEAQQEVLGEAIYPFCERTDTIANPRSGEMPIPRDYQSTKHIVVNDRWGVHPLRYIPPNLYFSGANNESHLLRPYVYTLFGNTLFVHLTDGSGGCQTAPEGCNKSTLLHLYIAKPINLAKPTDTFLVPDEFIESVTLKALKRCEQARDNFDYAAVYDGEAERIIENMKLRYGPRQASMQNKARLPYGRRFPIR